MGDEEDLTIVSSWAPKAYECFAVELEELQRLQQQHEQHAARAHHELEARCKAEVDAQLLREFPEVYPFLNVASPLRSAVGSRLSTPAPPTPSGRNNGKRPKPKHTHQQMQSEVAVVSAKREALLQQHLQAAVAARQQQPASMLAAQYTEQLSSMQRQVELFVEREAQELRRFTSKPLGAYALGEVLEVPQALPPPPAATSSPSAAAAATAAAGAGATTSPSLKHRTSSFRRNETAAAAAAAAAAPRAPSDRVATATSGGTGRGKPKRVERAGRAQIVEKGEHAGGDGTGARDRSPGGASAADDATVLSKPPPFLIDAHQFAVEYNEMLKREYGFRPAMTNSFATADARFGKGEAATTLKDQLRTHAPGHTSKESAAAAAAAGGWAPSCNNAAARTTGAASADAAGTAALEASPSPPDAGSGAPPKAHSFPKRKPAAASSARTTTALAATKRGGNAAKAAEVNPLDGVECSVKGGCLTLSTCVNVPMRQTVRFVNQNAYRTRLRLKPASHPWLTYRCIRISPAATTAPETPLNCGGYVEVEVVFCPTSIEAATATLDAVLEMGVARELNDRAGKGAQWQFTSVPVRGEVVLPRFAWWTAGQYSSARSSGGTDLLVLNDADDAKVGGAGAEGDVGEGDAKMAAAMVAPPWLLSFDELAAFATPLAASGPDADAVGFGQALLLASLTQTLYLQNVGSTAVVHILSSSPEFTVSLPAETATSLPPLRALPLYVTFSPLSEGPCEATLTVAVRASSAAESPVLSEHTVALHGVGVVPRVSIASLGPQLVQQGTVPQWQLCDSEAPLHVVLRDTIPGVPTDVPITVRNDCAVPLPYHWRDDPAVLLGSDARASGDAEEAVADGAGVLSRGTTVSTATAAIGGGARTSTIAPASGVLPPNSTSTFTLTVTPLTLQPLQTLYNLFLDRMPDPAAPQHAAKLPFVDAEVLELYRRSRPIPCRVQETQDEDHDNAGRYRLGSGVSSPLEGDNGGEGAAPVPGGFQITYLDPITAFTRSQTDPDGRGRHAYDAVFVTGFLTYQQPVLPSLSIEPATLEERVECLIQTRTTRTVTLLNNSPIAMHFLLDPTPNEFAASVHHFARLLDDTAVHLTYDRWRSSFPASDGIAVQYQPRKGKIPPQGSVAITVHFTLEACGPHYAVVPCWVPEVEVLCAKLAAAAAAAVLGAAAVASKRPSLSSPTNLRLLPSGGAGSSLVATPPAGGPGSTTSRRRHHPTPPTPSQQQAQQQQQTPPTQQQQGAQPQGPPQTTPLRAGVRPSSAAGRRSKSATPMRPGTGSGPVTVASAEDVHQQSVIEEPGGHFALHVTANGVGPSVKTSVELLDFGLIELGQEAAASFTVLNPNPIPVVFDLTDPLMRHPPRFVFIPETFRLGAGNTVEVTVFRKAVSTEDAQTFFELTVRDGGASVAIETRATIQQPLLVVEDPVVQFGVVPERVWQSGSFHVSNRSALDTVFNVVAAAPAPAYMELDYRSEHVLRAGEQLTVPVRCRFRVCPPPTSPCRGEASTSLVSTPLNTAAAAALGDPAMASAYRDAYSTLLGVVSKRSRQALLVEVRCDRVEPLAVSVDVVKDVASAALAASAELDAASDASAGSAVAAAATARASAEAFVSALLWNALEAALPRDAARGSSVTPEKEERPSAVVARPYCTPVRLVDHMPDDVPLARQFLTVVLENYTGCEARYEASAQNFSPLAMESSGAQSIFDKRRKKTWAAAAAQVQEGSPASTSRSVSVSRHNIRTTGASAAAEASNFSRRVTQSRPQSQHPPPTPFSALETRARGGSGRGAGAGGDMESLDGPAAMPAFWVSSVQSGVTPQQQLRRLVEAAQKVLGDGRRCVTLLGAAVGSLGPYAQVRLPVRLLCALPGCYAQKLRVRADATLPWLHVPVDYEVYGKPIVLDATTSGLTKEGGRDGKEVLLMPPVIAPLGTSRRTIRLVNRVSRDMDVTVEVFPCPLGVAVHAIDPDAPADQVELRLCAMTAEDREKERHRVGRVTATPVQLRIPAHARREVVLEFTPSAQLAEAAAADGDADDGEHPLDTSSSPTARHGSGVPGAAATAKAAVGNMGDSDSDDGGDEAMLPPTEHWWQGSVCVHATLAQSELNDIFLVDDFYAENAARYPSQRIARPISGVHGAGSAGGGGVAGTGAAGSRGSGEASVSVAQLSAMRPLRTRPGGRVMRGGRVVWATEAEQRVLDKAAAAGDAAAAAAGAMQASARARDGAATASSDDDERDAGDAGRDNSASSGRLTVTSHRPDAIPPLDVLLREAEERQALVRYMDQRRRDLQEESRKYFTSIELRLRARCGRPHLTVEPSERCVTFPAVQRADDDAPAAATAAPTAAASPACMRTLRLTNRNSSPLRFALALLGGAVDSMPGTAGLFTITRCALWRSGHDAAVELFATPAPSAATAAAATATLSNTLTTAATACGSAIDRPTTAAAAGTPHEYVLDSMDALDVQVVVDTESAAWRRECAAAAATAAAAGSVSTFAATAKAQPALSVEGVLQVQFLPTSDNADSAAANVGASAAIAGPATSTGAGAAATAHGVETPCQLLPLRVPLTTPSLECSPGVVWFRPGQQRHDGRRQVSYAQTLLLRNRCAVPVRFCLLPVTNASEATMEAFRTQQARQQLQDTAYGNTAVFTPALAQELLRVNTATTQLGAPATQRECDSIVRRVKAVLEMPDEAPPAEGREGLVYVNDPAQFTLSPTEGVVPAASLGGEPGQLEVRVSFDEFSDVRYEALFQIVIPGSSALPPTYVVLRGDSRDTEVWTRKSLMGVC